MKHVWRLIAACRLMSQWVLQLVLQGACLAACSRPFGVFVKVLHIIGVDLCWQCTACTAQATGPAGLHAIALQYAQLAHATVVLQPPAVALDMLHLQLRCTLQDVFREASMYVAVCCCLVATGRSGVCVGEGWEMPSGTTGVHGTCRVTKFPLSLTAHNVCAIPHTITARRAVLWLQVASVQPWVGQTKCWSWRASFIFLAIVRIFSSDLTKSGSGFSSRVSLLSRYQRRIC